MEKPKRVNLPTVRRSYIQSGRFIECRVLPTIGHVDSGILDFTLQASSEADAKKFMEHLSAAKV